MTHGQKNIKLTILMLLSR